MTQIELKEQQKILLDIAREFDKVCTTKGIPYYMLGGTMLGAIRHKGFIPWDDDMDFGVPIEFFPHLIESLRKELPKELRCCTHDNCPSIFYPFIKIENCETIIDDKQIPLPVKDKIGINVDVFPLVLCNKNDKEITRLRKISKICGIIHTDSRRHGKLVNLAKRILRIISPLSKDFLYNQVKKRILHLESGPYLANIMGRWKFKEIIPYEWYGNNKKYKFEGLELSGIQEYDLYLRNLYGDYMQLPPKNEQISNHATNAFWKN